MAKQPRRDPTAEVMASDNPLARRMGLAGRKQIPLTDKPIEDNESGGASVAVPAEQSTTPPRKLKTTQPKAPRKSVVEAKETLKMKRCIVSDDDGDLMDAAAKAIGRKVGTTVQFSPITRAMWVLLADAVEQAIDDVPAPSLKRPANAAPSDEIAEFEQELSAYLHDLIRTIKPGER